MTPAINVTRASKVEHKIHQYSHDATNLAYGLEAVEKLDLAQAQVFKTLVVDSDKGLAVAVIPVACKLNMKLMAKALNAKRVAMAAPYKVERSTGYVLGGVSPIGQKKALLTVIHLSADKFQTIFVSAGRRGLEIEMAPQDLLALTNAKFSCLCL
jgi:Cys-tRNA(Pro)/Cys-tRNA(Cys) deacylase